MSESEQFNPGSRNLYRFFRVIVRAILPLIARTTVTGLENVPHTGPVLLAPNHLSWFDIPSVAAPIPRQVYMMGKDTNFQIPILGKILRVFGSWPVRRHEIDRQALKNCQACLRAGNPLFIFPEGTRSRTGGLQKGWPGVALIALQNPGVPIIPVAIWGSQRVLKKPFIPFFGPRVYIHYGKPIVLVAKGGKRRRDELPAHIDRIMHEIAAMLPPQYRGVYGTPPAEPVAAAATAAPLEPPATANPGERTASQPDELPTTGEPS